LIFYKEWTKNVGYILLFIIFVLVIFYYPRTVTSGYYAIINIMNDKIKSIMHITSSMQYGEMITNRDVTITFCLIFLSIGACTVLNALISNYMSIIPTMAFTLPFAIFGCYFALVPKTFFAIMLISGYVGVYAMKRSNHYRADAKIKDFKIKKDSGGSHYIYHSNGKITFQVVGILALIAACLILTIGLFFPNKNIHVSDRMKSIRQKPDEIILRIVNGGIMGLFNRYSGAGGMSDGKLGGVAALTPDYQTDLVVRMAPTSTQPIYLRGYIGGKYEGDHWVQSEMATDQRMGASFCNYEYDCLLRYASTHPNLTTGKLQVTNKGANENYRYLPYYTDLRTQTGIYYGNFGEPMGTSPIGQMYEAKFVRYQDGVDGKSNFVASGPEYTEVPIQNQGVIKKFCDENHLQNKNLNEVISIISKRFQDSYPYSARPGMMPMREDFVNYFLEKGKTGYCTHYASATTLILRYLGYGARYVEGYVVSYDEVRQGKKVAGENPNDWYKGKLKLTATDVVDVEVDDSKAHAWVEVNDPNFGWRVVDTTPAADDEAVDDSVWSVLGDALGGNQKGTGKGSGGSWKLSGLIGIIEVLAVLYLLWMVYRLLRFLLRKNKGKKSMRGYSSEALVASYAYLCHILRSVEKDFEHCATHTEQIQWMGETYQLDKPEVERLLEVMQQCSYGPDSIDSSEVREYKLILHQIKKKIQKHATFKQKIKIFRTI
jgi:hypothetical protein